ncbi:hypothetical protein F5Y16DRAFT_422715 [Xylariaceae sp. FL0255]|nr:hypothetical protein F5Y16DRAFT_422715 [Xylariaceae sp. FL0255]
MAPWTEETYKALSPAFFENEKTFSGMRSNIRSWFVQVISPFWFNTTPANSSRHHGPFAASDVGLGGNPGLLANLIARDLLAFVGTVPCWIPLHLPWCNGEFAAAVLIVDFMVMNVFTIINSIIWNSDDVSNWDEIQYQVSHQRQWPGGTKAMDQAQGSIRLQRQIVELRKELTISREEVRRAWKELGRKEQEERERPRRLPSTRHILVILQSLPSVPNSTPGSSPSYYHNGQSISPRPEGRGRHCLYWTLQTQDLEKGYDRWKVYFDARNKTEKS